jgi:hypothetical protein
MYVTAFPSGGAWWQISTNGGEQPRWPRQANEILLSRTPITFGAHKSATAIRLERGPSRIVAKFAGLLIL